MELLDFPPPLGAHARARPLPLQVALVVPYGVRPALEVGARASSSSVGGPWLPTPLCPCMRATCSFGGSWRSKTPGHEPDGGKPTKVRHCPPSRIKSCAIRLLAPIHTFYFFHPLHSDLVSGGEVQQLLLEQCGLPLVGEASREVNGSFFNYYY